MKTAAIYARFSSEGQREASIDDQVRNCIKLIKDRGWRIGPIFSDRAISGATTLRPGYQALLAGARAQQFDVVVSEGLDRLSRDPEAMAALFKLLYFHGILLVTRSDNEVNELHIALKGAMNSLALKDLAMKTHRGLEGRVRQGRSGGGRAYGYRAVRPSGGNDGERGHREIVPAEAEVVRRIFTEFAAGASPKAIARGQNKDGIPGPSGKPWRDTTIRGHATRGTGIVRNALYIGRIVWNKQTYVREPTTGKRVARVRDPSEIITAEVPALRIVEQALWEKVAARLVSIRQSARSESIRRSEFWKHRRSRHLLSGLVSCGECGSSMDAVGKDYLGCSAARRDSGCTNRKSVRRSAIELAVLEGLKTRLMAPEMVREFISAFHAELNRLSALEDARRSQLADELEALKRKLSGLYDAIAEGLRTPGLKDQLLELEARQERLKAEIAAAPPPRPRLHPRLAETYRDMVSRLRDSLADENARSEAADILRGLIERVTVRSRPDGTIVELTGDILKMIRLPGGSVPDPFQSSVKVVAGAGFEPTTFRL